MFHLFHEEEVGQLLTKIIAGTVRTQRDGRHPLQGTEKIWRIFADLNNPNLPKFADKQFALSKMNLTSMEVSMFNSLFFKLF